LRRSWNNNEKKDVKMQKLLRIQYLSFLMISVVIISSQEIYEYSVKKTDSPLTIDGHLDEEEWTIASQTENFVILGDDATPPGTTSWGKILWDDTNMYVGFFCQDTNIWATYQDRDDQLYQEDAIEVYIDPDGDGETYLEIEVNPINTIFDLWLTKPWDEGGFGHSEWDMAGLSTAVWNQGSVANNADRDNSWICEMLMPFSEMEFASGDMNIPPETGDIWRFNLYRFDRNYTNDPGGEATGWNQTSGGQHEPEFFAMIAFEEDTTTNTIESDPANSPEHYTLFQNYPNPFNPATMIKFRVAQSGLVTVKIYNLQGQEVETVFHGYKTAGVHRERWDASGLSSGIYICRLTAGKFSQSKKLIFQK
jgi:hypothetical protein